MSSLWHRSTFATYEFSVVLCLLFTMDNGFLHQTSNKAKVTDAIRKLHNDDFEDIQVNDGSRHKEIIFNGMAVVNTINMKKSKLKNCRDFSIAFINIIMHESTGCDGIRVIFDRYIDKSLKTHTRNIWTHGVPVQYRVLEETQIGHLDTKQFLSSIEMKNELSANLSHKLASSMTSRSIDYVTVASHAWETCRILILNWWNITKKKPIQAFWTKMVLRPAHIQLLQLPDTN